MDFVSNLALGSSLSPEDCQAIAFAELSTLNGAIDNLLKSKVKLDADSSAHLRESASRIDKVLDAQLSLSSP